MVVIIHYQEYPNKKTATGWGKYLNWLACYQPFDHWNDAWEDSLTDLLKWCTLLSGTGTACTLL